MAVELAEVAAGLPAAASLALAGGITNLRESRRRAALNEAMHELRRPLQVLSFSLPGDSTPAAPIESSLRLAAVALERLEREVNGGSHEEAVAEVSVGRLIEEAAQRWRKPAMSRACTVEFDWNGDTTFVHGDRFGLSQALDNLLSNAIEHGGGKVSIKGRLQGDWVSISVTDAGAASPVEAAADRPRRNGRSRHGHGLRVVARIARSHGGSFTLRRTAHGTEAVLRLPLRRRGSGR